MNQPGVLDHVVIDIVETDRRSPTHRRAGCLVESGNECAGTRHFRAGSMPCIRTRTGGFGFVDARSFVILVVHLDLQTVLGVRDSALGRVRRTALKSWAYVRLRTDTSLRCI